MLKLNGDDMLNREKCDPYNYLIRSLIIISNAIWLSSSQYD